MHLALVFVAGSTFMILGWIAAGKAWRLVLLAVAAVIAAFALGHFHL